MKFRGRDVNVFSISALDLFASALGAFILVSVVLMPYFLRVDPEEVHKLLRQLKQAQAEQVETQKQLQQAQRELKELKDAPKLTFPHLDVVIALDTTGSMRSEVDGLRQDIDEFAKLMLDLAPSLGIGIIDFKDRCDPSTEVRVFPLRVINSGSLPSLLSFTRSTTAEGSACNRDSPEALATALKRGIASTWRSEGEARIVVVITDNPPYDDEKIPALNAARAFAARGPAHKVSTVFTDTGGSEAGTEAYLKSLAQAGNGKFTQSGRSFVVTMLSALAGL